MISDCKHPLREPSSIDLVGGAPIYMPYVCSMCGRTAYRRRLGAASAQYLGGVPMLVLVCVFLGTVLPPLTHSRDVWLFVLFVLGLVVTGLIFRGLGLVLRTQSRWLRVLCGWVVMVIAVSLARSCGHAPR